MRGGKEIRFNRMRSRVKILQWDARKAHIMHVVFHNVIIAALTDGQGW